MMVMFVCALVCLISSNQFIFLFVAVELKKSPLISSSQAIEAIQGVQFNDMDREHLVEILFNLQGSNAAESWIKVLFFGWTS